MFFVNMENPEPSNYEFKIRLNLGSKPVVAHVSL